MIGAERVTKRSFYRAGGLSNPQQYRKANSRGVWSHYRLHR